MQTVTVRSRKYDGSLRDEYQAFLHACSADAVVVYVPPGTAVFDHRKGASVDTPDGLIEIYSLYAWYHIWHICEQISGINETYVHIALPARYSGTTIEWTDLDLDIRVNLDGSIDLLDVDEFQENAGRMRYPVEVVETCLAACEQVRAGLRGKAGAFDRDSYVGLYRRIKAACA